MKWLKDEGCPWDADAYAYANGRIMGRADAINWLRENGCPEN